MTIAEQWCKALVAPPENPGGPATAECKRTDSLRFFVQGWKCPIHTPNALAGVPELEPGPGIPAYRICKLCPHERGKHGDPVNPGRCSLCKNGHMYEEVR